jgi:hypothetical protein
MDSSLNTSIIKVTKSRAKNPIGYIAHRGKVRNIYIKLEGQPRRPRLRWKNDVRIEVKGISCGDVE